MPEPEETPREEAVRIVDASYGYTYTCEFSASPEAHREEYDIEEARIIEERA